MIDYDDDNEHVHVGRYVSPKSLYGALLIPSVLLVVVHLCVAATGENLLLNPSFETIEGGVPAHWKVFITAQSGAEARADDRDACHGRWCGLIRNPERLEPEPYHNWSQNLSGEFAKKTRIVGGLIKTSDADGAAVWLQCWRKEPLGVVHVATTSDTYPLSGTNDWTPVAMKVNVPEETDFLVLRCVLKGKGTAWFDDLRIIDGGAQANTDDLISELSKAAPRGDGEGVKKQLLEETESIARTIKELRASNEALSQELARVREELKTLREKLQPERRVPPLVPHGYRFEENPQ